MIRFSSTYPPINTTSKPNEPDNPMNSNTPPDGLEAIIGDKINDKRYTKWIAAFKDYISYKNSSITQPIVKQWIKEQVKNWDKLQLWQIEALNACNTPFADLAKRWITRLLELKKFKEQCGHARVRRNHQ